MVRPMVIAVLIVALAAPCLGVEIIRIPLDLGTDELALGENGIHLDFDADRELTDISGLWLQVSGCYLDHRSFGCVDGNPFSCGYGDGETGLFQGFVIDEQADCVTENVIGHTENGGAVFDLELGIRCAGSNEDLVFLAGGAGTVYLRSLDCSVPPYPVIAHCTPSAYIESATLVIQLGSLVATEKQTWGSLKALYR